MNIKKQLGEKIKRLRKEKHLTQEQLAEIIDIAPRNLVNIETGVNFPKADTLEKILIALNATMSELFDNEHLTDSEELLKEIEIMINSARENHYILEKIYKILKTLTDNS